jgi:predicted nucleotidyltransferase
MALEEGADLVLELPTLYALSSGEGFAFGGVSMLDALSVDGFCFGSECGDIALLQKVADVLVEEPAAYQERLKGALRTGASYPAAREAALSALLLEISHVIAEPNNILGIEYLKAVKRRKSGMIPVTLERNDEGYHGEEIGEERPSSATAIRRAYGTRGNLEDCAGALPNRVYSLLGDYSGHYPIDSDDFSSQVYYSLVRVVQKEDLTCYGEINRDMANRIQNHLSGYETFGKFADTLKTKNVTHSHITRSLFHVLLGIEQSLCRQVCRPVPYLRLLGMRQGAGELLRDVSVPVVTKVADYEKKLADCYSGEQLSFARECFRLDLFAAELYRQAMFEKTGVRLADEYRAGVVIKQN